MHDTFEKAFQIVGVPDWSFLISFSGLIMTRIVVMAAIIPFLVGKPVPTMIRTGFAVAMTIFLYPFLAPENKAGIPTAPVLTLVLYMKEMFYGLAIGLAASLMFYAFEAAGAMVDNQRGAAQARLLIPALAAESSIFGNFNYLFGISIFLSMGGHLLFLKALMQSYEVLPILEFPHSSLNVMSMLDEFMRTSGYILVLALQLTAPILITIFIADVVMAVMNKAAPAIHVWELGFILRGVLGVLMYFFASGLISEQMAKYSFQMVDQVKKVIELLAK